MLFLRLAADGPHKRNVRFHSCALPADGLNKRNGRLQTISRDIEGHVLLASLSSVQVRQATRLPSTIPVGSLAACKWKAWHNREPFGGPV